MVPVKVGSMFAVTRWRAFVTLLSLSFAFLSAQPGQAQPGPLTFFKNYFITGDYVVGGVGLRGQGINGLATGSIKIADVPPDADVVAAFLYWQVVTTSTAGPDSASLPVTFRGNPLRSADGPFGKLLTIEGTAPCWSSGGSTGSSGGSKKTYTFRADVLRYFEVDPGTGKLAVNDAHQVQLPDSGSGGNAVPLALGASLVVVYRDPDPLKPLSAIVIYDGGYTLDNSTGSMFQTIAGFYQPASPAFAKMTHIVGSGQLNKSESLLFDAGTEATSVLATNPFTASTGDSWDNPTFVNLSLGLSPGSVTQVTTGVSPSSDCLTWGAVIFKTDVQDTDEDGLLDIWETSSGLADPDGVPLPNLAAMLASPGQKDLFIEIGYMKTDVSTSYGGAVKPAHSHLPSLAALQLIAGAFAKESISVHFDVGNNYQGHPFVIPASLARGGEAIDETITQCIRLTSDPPWVCQFGPQPSDPPTSGYPGTVGWKSGFRFLRDEVLVAPPGQDCDAPGNSCVRRFDRNRKDMFRYALFAHAIGLPKSEDPESQDFHAPRTNTGIGDFPGGDVMVTLGGFADINGAPVDHDGLPGTPEVWTPFPVGTPFMQASTLMHELGHNMERRHGGEAFEPNCKPTYLSVMNYLYQLRGLLDNSGKPHLDFSGETLSPINERLLADGFVSGTSKGYRIGWYAPLVGSFLERRGTAALRHCDGSDLLILRDPNGTPVLDRDGKPIYSEPQMVRIDARTAEGGTDWKANGIPDPDGLPPVSPLDINFNGRIDGPIDGAAELPYPLRGSNDWANIRLNQLASRRSVGGLYSQDGIWLVGPMSLDVGKGDLGKGDLGKGDLGKGDLGKGDLGKGDLGKGDLGKGDLGKGDLGKGDLGGGDLFLGNPYQEGELDAETAGELARTPPNEFTACVLGENCPEAGTPLHAVRLGWTAPNVGGVSQFVVYRVAGDTLVPDTALTPWTEVGQVAVVPGQVPYSLVDGAQLLNAARYTYFAVAIYADGIKSDPSNLATITAVNEPPAAGADTYGTAEDTPITPITLPAPGVLANDADPDSPAALTAVLVTPLTDGTGTLTLNADGSFVYTPTADFYGTASFAYKAVATYSGGQTVETNTATVTITVSPVNDAPVAVNDGYATAEDTTLNQPAPGVLANDTDSDGPALTAVLAAGPAHGTLLLNLNGSFTYAPAANYFGPDAFTYRAFDGTFYSDPVTVALSVTAVNDPPAAGSDSYSMTQGGVLTIAAPGVLGNDVDIDSTLTAAVVTAPSNGTLSLASNGSFTYTPAGTFYGTDSFTYRASDGAASSTATVTMTVNKLVYGFVNVQNLPPPSTKTFNLGSAVPLAWQFTVNGVAYNSVNARPRITILKADNTVAYQGTPTDPGASSFQPPTATNGYKWQFNWQTKGLSAATYYVYVTSDQTSQTFPNTTTPPPMGGYAVKLK